MALALMSLIWSFNWIVMKRALHYIGPLDFSALRTLFGTLLLFALLWLRGESRAPTPLRDTILIGLAQTAAFRAPLVRFSLVEAAPAGWCRYATMPFHRFAWARCGKSHAAPLAVRDAAVGLLLVLEPGARSAACAAAR